MLSGIKSIISGVVGWSGATAASSASDSDKGGDEARESEGGKQEEPAKHPDAIRPVEKRDYTAEELRQFDGSVPDAAILIAIRGIIFDVSPRADIYGACCAEPSCKRYVNTSRNEQKIPAYIFSTA